MACDICVYCLLYQPTRNPVRGILRAHQINGKSSSKYSSINSLSSLICTLYHINAYGNENENVKYYCEQKVTGLYLVKRARFQYSV